MTSSRPGLRHRIDGPADGPLLILGPSLGTTLELWDPQMDALTRTWRVLRYELPGHTDTAPIPPGEPSVHELAGDVLALADELGARRFAVGGVSLGGAIAATVAARAPDRIGGLVVCCSSARFGDPQPWLERAARVGTDGLAPLADTLVARWFTRGCIDRDPQPVRHARAMLDRVGAAGYAHCCTAIAQYDLRGRLGGIRAPSLIVAGADDPATPVEHARVLHRSIVGSELLVVPQAAHLANLEQAEQVTAALVRHLDGVRERETGVDR